MSTKLTDLNYGPTRSVMLLAYLLMLITFYLIYDNEDFKEILVILFCSYTIMYCIHNM